MEVQAARTIAHRFEPPDNLDALDRSRNEVWIQHVEPTSMNANKDWMVRSVTHAHLFWASTLPSARTSPGMLSLLLAVAIGSLLPSSKGLAEERLPKVVVSNVRKVFDNGQHNAFTDLVRFAGKYYLTFRSCPDGHMVHPSSSIRILASADGWAWEQVAEFRIEKRDTRDPHFLVFRDRLFVYTGTWFSGDTTLPRDQYDLNLHLGYAVWTENGRSWSSPIPLEGTFGHYVWRAATHGELAYLCGRRKKDFAVGPKADAAIQSVMLESEDGLVWRTKAKFQETQGDEVAFRFDDAGGLLAIGRRGRETAELIRSTPPYVEWERHDLGLYIGGPLLASWGERTVVGGRVNVPGVGPRTVLSWLNGRSLHQFAELPSDGDNSYPGWIDLGGGRAWVSWYSSHERDQQNQPVTAIYMADLQMID